MAEFPDSLLPDNKGAPEPNHTRPKRGGGVPLTELPPPAWIEQVSGPSDGTRTRIPATGRARIGRAGDGLTVALPFDQGVSSLHAQVSYHDGQWWLCDLESTNGTRLEGEQHPLVPTVEVPLSPDRAFQVSATDLLLVLDHSADQAR